jgi:hypothetical protein
LPVPPTVAVNVWLCDGSREIDGGVTATIMGAFTVRLSCFEFEPPAFVAVTVGVKTPAAVGVPLMTPVDVAKDNPAGSAPLVTLHVIDAVPVAAIVCE